MLRTINRNSFTEPYISFEMNDIQYYVIQPKHALIPYFVIVPERQYNNTKRFIFTDTCFFVRMDTHDYFSVMNMMSYEQIVAMTNAIKTIYEKMCKHFTDTCLALKCSKTFVNVDEYVNQLPKKED